MSKVVTLGPVGFKPTGAYDNTREYKKLDVVIYQGSSYVAKSDSIGQLPTNTTYWELLVQKGDTGEKGEKGDPGEVTEEQLDEAMVRANMVYNALPKVSDEGDNLTLDGTANCPMKMELKGNTEQDSYSGINIFNINNSGNVSSEVIIGDNDYISCTYNNSSGSNIHYSNIFKDKNDLLQPSTNYLVVCEIKSVSGTGRIQPFTNGGTGSIATNHSSYYFNDLTAGQILILPVTTKATLEIYDIRSLIIFDVGNSGSITFRLSLLTDTTITSDTFAYEPYVGGTPSPNPDYPQDVRVVTGNNIIKIDNRNLWDEEWEVGTIQFDKLQSNWGQNVSANDKMRCKNYIPVDSSKSYYCSFGGSIGSIYVIMYDENKQPISDNQYGYIDAKNQVLRLIPNAKYIRFYCTAGYGATYQNDICINYSDSNNGTYTKHYGETYPINLGTMELCKIPNTSYQDIIFHAINGDSFYDTLDNATKQTLTYGKWYKHSEIGKYVYNNNLSTNGLDADQVNFNTPVLNIEADLSYPNLSNRTFCNMLQTQPINGTGLKGTTAQKRIRIDTKGYGTTYDEVRTIFANNNLTIYYGLETPTNTEITDTTLISQLNAIENSVSYDTQTNIVQENYSEPFIINAECVRSLKDIFELID